MKKVIALLLVLTTLGTTGCANKQQAGTVVGTVVGVAVGSLFGDGGGEVAGMIVDGVEESAETEYCLKGDAWVAS